MHAWLGVVRMDLWESICDAVECSRQVVVGGMHSADQTANWSVLRYAEVVRRLVKARSLVVSIQHLHDEWLCHWSGWGSAVLHHHSVPVTSQPALYHCSSTVQLPSSTTHTATGTWCLSTGTWDLRLEYWYWYLMSKYWYWYLRLEYCYWYLMSKYC